EALAAAGGHVVLVLAELHRAAAGGFEHELVEATAHQGAADASVAFLQLDAHDALADAGQDVDVVDLKVDDVAVAARAVNRFFLPGQPASHYAVALIEPGVLAADLRGRRAEGPKRRAQRLSLGGDDEDVRPGRLAVLRLGVRRRETLVGR